MGFALGSIGRNRDRAAFLGAGGVGEGGQMGGRKAGGGPCVRRRRETFNFAPSMSEAVGAKDAFADRYFAQ